MARKRHHQAARERDLHTIRLLNDLLDKDQVMSYNVIKALINNLLICSKTRCQLWQVDLAQVRKISVVRGLVNSEVRSDFFQYIAACFVWLLEYLLSSQPKDQKLPYSQAALSFVFTNSKIRPHCRHRIGERWFRLL